MDDANPWPPARLDALDAAVRLYAATDREVAVLRETVHRHTRDIVETRERLIEQLDDLAEVASDIHAHVRLTNGRVTTLEAARIAEEAVRVERARAVEERRGDLALRLATNGWVKPTLVATLASVGTLFLAKWLG